MCSLASPRPVVNKGGSCSPSAPMAGQPSRLAVGALAARSRKGSAARAGGQGDISLDTRGTSSQIEHEARNRRRWRRRGREHSQLVRSLEACGWYTEADKVRSCGRLMVYSCSDCGSMAGRSNLSCDNRLCSYCSHVRSEKIAHKLVPVVEACSNPVLIVLTVKNGQDLAERDNHLRVSFRKLVRRVAFQRAFKGGIVLEEVTYSPKGWHPHLNILADGYMDQGELSRLWRLCTGDSYVCHIQYIAPEGRLQGIYEAVKYCAKLPDVVGDAGRVREFLEHFRGRRMMWAFGSLYGVASRVEEEVAGEIAQEVEVVDPAEVCPVCQGAMHLSVNSVWSKQECRPAGNGWWLYNGDNPRGDSS